MSSGALHARIVGFLDGERERIFRVARAIHGRPELGYREHFAAGLLADELAHAGIPVERGAHGVETALRAEFGARSSRAEPREATVAILAEYDALPEIGHACGHNLIAAAALGAALALRSVEDALPGRVRFLGTPAEEGAGARSSCWRPAPSPASTRR